MLRLGRRLWRVRALRAEGLEFKAWGFVCLEICLNLKVLGVYGLGFRA